MPRLGCCFLLAVFSQFAGPGDLIDALRAAATRDLMLPLHRQLTANHASEADALRRAALETMRQPLRRHPFYWAGFVLIGDGQ